MNNFIKALRISLVMIIICGFLYPLAITGISQLLFPKQSNGSIVEYNGKKVGSELLGQSFTGNRFFHGRVSAYNYNTYTVEETKPDNNGKTAYTGVSSGSENLAPSNPKLVDRVIKEMNEFIRTYPDVKKENIPTDLVTSSGSGLDPHISIESAKIQIPTISKATGIDETELSKIVDNCTDERTFGIFGEPGVNFFKANIEIQKRLDKK
ncbi:MAG TPA: potassium-transporting ATPase subunit KdpC [Pseudobacteroides sp.]|uniref:potassium-transporting ATPase subunit KdpC n=1 Tax=Pseudobacteroides sp. TaxID=1968840 RepID=UPI002F92F5E1